MLTVIVSQVIENEFGKDGESVFASFTLHYFYLHGVAVDGFDLEHTQFIEAQTGTIEQADHTTVFNVSQRCK